MSTSPTRRRRIHNFQAQADELGDNYFVSFSKTNRKQEHWTYYAIASFIVFLMSWQVTRFYRDFIAHSLWTIMDGFLLILLFTILVALLLPRERDPDEAIQSTMLVHECTIFQKGRLPIMREFSNFVNSDSTWWVNNVASLLARYVDQGDSSTSKQKKAKKQPNRSALGYDISSDSDDSSTTSSSENEQDADNDEAIQELEEVVRRTLNLIYRIIRNSDAPKVLRKMLKYEAKMYMTWIAGDGFIFNWMAALPECLHDIHFDPRLGPPKTKLLDDHECRRYRLWLKTFLAAHLFKRHLWSLTPSAYPNFSQRCVVCREREVEVAFIGCGHAVTCGDCGRMCLYGNHTSTGLCPMCRCPIEVLTDDTLSRKNR